jgi:hypothetical protein
MFLKTLPLRGLDPHVLPPPGECRIAFKIYEGLSGFVGIFHGAGTRTFSSLLRSTDILLLYCLSVLHACNPRDDTIDKECALSMKGTSRSSKQSS